MAWKDVSVMSERLEFVVLTSAEGANVSELYRRFGVSRKTGYKWLSRYATEGRAGLVDQSRRPSEPDGSAFRQWPVAIAGLHGDPDLISLINPSVCVPLVWI